MSTGSRVSIPSSVRKTIQNIKEITGNHSEEEVYAMLKECLMDPNETTQKLLLQDTFHEVKRKKDKRKEISNNKEAVETRTRSVTFGRANRGNRGNYLVRTTSQDRSTNQNITSGKQTTIIPVKESAGDPIPSVPKVSINKEAPSLFSPASAIANGPTNVASGSTNTVSDRNKVHVSHPEQSARKQQEVSLAVDTNRSSGSLFLPINTNKNMSTNTSSGSLSLPINTNKNMSSSLGSNESKVQSLLSSNKSSISVPSSASLGNCFSSSDPVLIPSHDIRSPGAVGTIKREVGNQRVPVDMCTTGSNDFLDSVNGSSITQVASSNQEVAPDQLTDSKQTLPSLVHSGSNGGKYVSGFGSHAQVVGPPKGMEWKPKFMVNNPVQGDAEADASEPLVSSVVKEESHSEAADMDSKEAISEVQEKLEQLNLSARIHSDRQHVIIPNHIHVPESERSKLSFGSIDTWFGAGTQSCNGPDESPALSEHSHESEVEPDVLPLSDQNKLANDGLMDSHVQQTSEVQALETSSSVDGDGSVSANVSQGETKQTTPLPPSGQQHTPSSSYGLMPPVIGNQTLSFEGSEVQARDITRLPSFMVQQPFDAASYYAQLYRPNIDGDGRISPFNPPPAAAKYNGNIAVLPSQASQEGGSSLVLSTTGHTPLVPQATGVMQSSVSLSPQPFPVFRQPAGMHITHYPPNYIPYGHYFSPFYVSPTAIHQILSSNAFSQHHQPGNIYHSQSAVATAGLKYSLPQYKPGANISSPTPIGLPNNYIPYGPVPTNYNPGSTSTSGNSTIIEDLPPSQFKESNVYVTGQQSEGSAVWIAAPSREVPNLQNSFYSLPPQGQHMGVGTAQGGHGALCAYGPAQAVTAATMHPLQQSQSVGGNADISVPAGGFQQPQHTQLNWANSY